MWNKVSVCLSIISLVCHVFGELVNHLSDGFDFHGWQICTFTSYFQEVTASLHILSLMSLKKRWEEMGFINSFRKSLCIVVFEGFLSVRFWVMYLKWFDVRSDCTLAQPAYWFSCGCLCWWVTVVSFGQSSTFEVVDVIPCSASRWRSFIGCGCLCWQLCEVWYVFHSAVCTRFNLSLYLFAAGIVTDL